MHKLPHEDDDQLAAQLEEPSDDRLQADNMRP